MRRQRADVALGGTCVPHLTTWCSGRLGVLSRHTLYATSEPQTFTDGSPEGSPYLPNTDCVWVIHPSVPGGQVEVAVTWMDLEDDYDWLNVCPLATRPDAFLRP